MRQKLFGGRTGLSKADTGIRRVASTYGKAAFLTHGPKAGGMLAVESEAERLVSNLLSLDPTVRQYQAQPLTVDVSEGCLLHNREDKKAARARHKERSTEPVFYTPDFSARWTLGTETALEVTTDLFPRDEDYEEKLASAHTILRSHGLDFMRVVVPSYWRHPLLVNVPLLFQASLRTDLRPGPEVLERIGSLARSGAICLAEFCEGLGMEMRMGPVLIAFGALSVDIAHDELKGSTPASEAHGSLDHLCVLGRLAK